MIQPHIISYTQENLWNKQQDENEDNNQYDEHGTWNTSSEVQPGKEDQQKNAND